MRGMLILLMFLSLITTGYFAYTEDIFPMIISMIVNNFLITIYILSKEIEERLK